MFTKDRILFWNFEYENLNKVTQFYKQANKKKSNFE